MYVHLACQAYLIPCVTAYLRRITAINSFMANHVPIVSVGDGCKWHRINKGRRVFLPPSNAGGLLSISSIIDYFLLIMKHKFKLCYPL
jgi:hypothetical protein